MSGFAVSELATSSSASRRSISLSFFFGASRFSISSRENILEVSLRSIPSMSLSRGLFVVAIQSSLLFCLCRDYRQHVPVLQVVVHRQPQAVPAVHRVQYALCQLAVYLFCKVLDGG